MIVVQTALAISDAPLNARSMQETTQIAACVIGISQPYKKDHENFASRN